MGGSSDKMIPWRGRVRNPRKILVHQIEGVTLISLQIIEMFGVGLSKFWKMEFFLVFFFLVHLNLEIQSKSQRQELEELRKQIQGALESRSTAILQQLRLTFCAGKSVGCC